MSPDKPKVPRKPDQPLTFEDDDFVSVEDRLFRIHATAGEHPLAWNEFRTFGPLDRARWDPHPLPRGEHPGFGVAYTATDYVTPFAEVFQRYRRIDLTSRTPVLSGWEPTRALRLLDVTGNWPLRNGASRSLQHAPRSTCRAWARAIQEQCPQTIDGLLAESTLTGKDAKVVALWEGMPNRFPPAPVMSRALDHPALSSIVREVVAATGYGVAAR